MKLAHSAKKDLILNLRQQLDQQTESNSRQPLPTHVKTGWDALDDATGGGLFRGALNEVQMSQDACGILEALLPTFQNVTRAPGDPRRFWAWVHPQRLPYPPALSQLGFELDRWLVVRPSSHQEHLWALETILRSGLCEGLVTFMGAQHQKQNMDPAWRRLQLAAREGHCTALLLSSRQSATSSSPAALRLAVRPLPSQGRRRRLLIEILKCRGRAFASPVLLEWSHDALDEPAFSRSQPGKSDTSPSRQQNTSIRALRA